MEPDWINASVGVISLVIILAGLVFKQAKELSDYKTHVAETYATKEEVKDLTERLERQIETGFNRVYEILSKRETA
ncbi:hypothetical protein MHO82_21140 [Vibrio sp. Of7-15]|uniref:hypothetical protein n=1 Tax=Vibrio sp. Of7-15 TaxID=2724879 RepID=UPI001EF171D4|nr:hypothetical protein [Vibrio sp. Of7-15]MCG7499375.1 hypothetical protein [Vibrio sp. Of7-15]